jgi:hypothetical protein
MMTRHPRLLWLRTCVPTGALVAAMACSGVPEEDSPAAPVASALLETHYIPAGVSCFRVTAEGTRSVVFQEDVVAGRFTSVAASGLPTGSVTFRADAFALACKDLNQSDAPLWKSEPVVKTLAPGEVVSLVLLLRPVDPAAPAQP